MKVNTTPAGQTLRRKSPVQKVLASIRRNWLLYVFLLPAFLYIATFHYAPMYGLQIAFRKFRISDGFTGSKWVGLDWFERFFNSPRFWTILENTLSVSIYSLIVNFIFPIILAFVLNNIP